MKRKPTVKSLKRKLDKVFSLMVRTRDAYLPCVSCGQKKELQAGHFVPRKTLATRWHPWNVNGECQGCNGFDTMHLLGYSRNLDKRYWVGLGEELIKISRLRWKPLPDQLARLIAACDDPQAYEAEWFAVQKEFES